MEPSTGKQLVNDTLTIAKVWKDSAVYKHHCKEKNKTILFMIWNHDKDKVFHHVTSSQWAAPNHINWCALADGWNTFGKRFITLPFPRSLRLSGSVLQFQIKADVPVKDLRALILRITITFYLYKADVFVNIVRED